MKFILYILTTLFCNIVYCQINPDTNKLETQNNLYVKTDNYEGVIFLKDNVRLDFKDYYKYTPTLNEIQNAEEIIRKNALSFDKNKRPQPSCLNIHENLSDYKRQYFGLIDTAGNHIIFMNFFYDQSNKHKNWKTEEIIELLRCTYYWDVKVNLTNNILFDFNPNYPFLYK